MLDKVIGFNAPGRAIRARSKRVFTSPTIFDLIPGTDIPKYIVALGALDESSHAAFSKDVAYWHREKAEYEAKELELIYYLLDNISPSAMTTLQCQPTFTPLIDASNSYDLFTLIKLTFSSSTNATMVHLRIKNFMNLKMVGDNHEQFIEDLKQAEITLLQDLGSDDPHLEGYIKVAHLTANLYITGVNQTIFQPMIDKTLLDNPNGKIDQLWPLVTKFHTFFLQRLALKPAAQSVASSMISQSSVPPDDVLSLVS